MKQHIDDGERTSLRGCKKCSLELVPADVSWVNKTFALKTKAARQRRSSGVAGQQVSPWIRLSPTHESRH